MSELAEKKELLPVPNATAVLVLGIISIPTCFCLGIVGLICGIIALVKAKKGLEAYNEAPENFKPGSLQNLKAGKICAIVGTSLSGLYFLYFLFYMIIMGTYAVGVMSLFGAAAANGAY